MPELVQDDQQGEPDAGQDVWQPGGHQASTLNAWTSADATLRASASASKRSSKLSTEVGSTASSEPWITRGMSTKPSVPSRNACTAISLAAFKTHGPVPPAIAASR